MLGRNDIKFNFWQKYKNTKMNSSTNTKHKNHSRTSKKIQTFLYSNLYSTQSKSLA